MAVTSMVRRVINLPMTGSVKAEAVVADIKQAIAPYHPVYRSSDDEYTQEADFLLTSAQDTTLQGLMASWASRLGLAQLDTHSVTVSAGHP